VKIFCTCCGNEAHDICVPHQKIELSICQACLPFYNRSVERIAEIERDIYKYHHLTGKPTSVGNSVEIENRVASKSD